MPKKTPEMTALEIRRLRVPGRHAVGGVPGLLLVVKESGAKSWILRTVVGNRRRNIGLGGYPEVTLVRAREKAREAREMIEQGKDPVEEKQAMKRALAKQSKEKGMTFEVAARLCFEKKAPEFRNAKHAHDWFSSVERYAISVMGSTPVGEIELQDVLAVLKPIWQDKTETATRLRQRMENILNWATVSGYREGDNPARWKGHLDAILPKPTRIKNSKHFPALSWHEIGGFMNRLRKCNGSVPRCLEFLILTACRSGEARSAVWDEIDFESKTWTIPGGRMKAGKEHRVPLASDVIDLLQGLPRFEGSPYLFPSSKGGPLSDMALSMFCRRMEIESVPHGFRSTFRDWCAESTNFPREVAEMALAHSIGNGVEAAYRRGELLDKRRHLMDSWAKFCNMREDSEGIIPISRAL